MNGIGAWARTFGLPQVPRRLDPSNRARETRSKLTAFMSLRTSLGRTQTA
jgi:hypothetical protein